MCVERQREPSLTVPNAGDPNVISEQSRWMMTQVAAAKCN